MAGTVSSTPTTTTSADPGAWLPPHRPAPLRRPARRVPGTLPPHPRARHPPHTPRCSQRPSQRVPGTHGRHRLFHANNHDLSGPGCLAPATPARATAPPCAAGAWHLAASPACQAPTAYTALLAAAIAAGARHPWPAPSLPRQQPRPQRTRVPGSRHTGPRHCAALRGGCLAPCRLTRVPGTHRIHRAARSGHRSGCQAPMAGTVSSTPTTTTSADPGAWLPPHRPAPLRRPARRVPGTLPPHPRARHPCRHRLSHTNMTPPRQHAGRSV